MESQGLVKTRNSCIAIVSLLGLSTAYGAPTVTGQVIAWPDDGWYQVQTADTYTQICAGTRSCDVAPGIYNVINHTTGQRFTNIEVPVDPSAVPGGSPIVITGNVISWPDDGWYQVQDANTYAEVCGGGRSCEVASGTYIVINHTSGQRFTDIVVNGESGGGVTEPITHSEIDLLGISQDLIVTAAGYQLDQLAVVADDLAFIVAQQTTINWPNDDWYQVQNAESYASVCNGGAQCKILPGSYVVINHATGERTPLVVPYVSLADQPEANRLAETAVTFTLPAYPDIVSTELTISRTQYNCENGGSLIKEEGGEGGEFYDAFGSLIGGITDKKGFLFDQCQMSVSNSLIPDGDYVIDGYVQTEIKYSYGDSQSTYDFDGFSIIGDNGLEYRVHGQAMDTDGYDFNYLRSATIDEYQKVSPDAQSDELIRDISFNYETLNNTTVLAAPYKTLDVNGMVRNAQTAYQQVTITTEPTLIWGSEPFVPFNGSIEMLAEDGSFLYQIANPYVEPDNEWALFTDFDYTAVDGEQTQLSLQRYEFPFGFGSSSCFQYRSGETGRLDCVDSFLQ